MGLTFDFVPVYESMHNSASIQPLRKLPGSAWRSLGGYLNYESWGAGPLYYAGSSNPGKGAR
jgi:hypothetical protein